jgi:hypothetical protein
MINVEIKETEVKVEDFWRFDVANTIERALNSKIITSKREQW